MSKSGVRIADENELYGIVTKCLGNGQLLIKIKDIPTERRCKIRGKFNKKENVHSNPKLVLDTLIIK
jgi:translation initiation factor IF-1